MLKQYILVLSLTLMLLPNYIYANHLIGGEMTYNCLGNGDYEVMLHIYRDCASDGGFDIEIDFATFQCDGTIDCGVLSQGSQGFKFKIRLDTVKFINFPDPSCELPQVCVEEGIYKFKLSEFGAFLPVTNNSYYIVHQRCCRNPTITNIKNPDEVGTTYSVAITPQSQEICNSSPSFELLPSVLTCINDSFSIENTASDIDGDSLVYSFAAPLVGGGNGLSSEVNKTCSGVKPSPPCPPPYNKVSYHTPIYDSLNPFGKSDALITINPKTGTISGIPDIQGQFTIGVKVSEYRNGVLLGYILREIQINVADCSNSDNRIGTICNDGNDETENDFIQHDCSCKGTVKNEFIELPGLFFSEYLVGVSNQTCIEIYNPSDVDISLEKENYLIRLFNKEYPDGLLLKELTGTILANNTYTLCYSSNGANSVDVADAIFDFNIDENDALLLESNGEVIDLFGNKSCFPDLYWEGDLGISTQGNSLVRCPCIQNGVKELPTDCGFPALSSEWIEFSYYDLSNLGTHITSVSGNTLIHALAESYCNCPLLCRERDSFALVEIYNYANGPKWINTWDLSTPIDTWYGVNINENGCVICLDLDGVPDCGTSKPSIGSGNNLSGFLPSDIGNLLELEMLFLSNNKLSSVIPREIGKLTKLQKIWLNNNLLSDVFPTGLILLKDLKEIALGQNQLTGELPAEISELSNLELFSVEHNNLIGCFPSDYLEICNITNNFSNNPQLPWQGDFSRFCNLEQQTDIVCEDADGKIMNGHIQSDCTCLESVTCSDIKVNDTLFDTTIDTTCAASSTLSISLPSGFSGVWQIDTNLVIDSINENGIMIDNLPIGISNALLHLDTLNCETYDPIRFEFLRLPPPILAEDTLLIKDNIKTSVDVLKNDSLIQNVPFTLRIIEAAYQGKVENNNNILFYQPPSDFLEKDQITYEVCYRSCANFCSQATLVIVKEATEVVEEEIEIEEEEMESAEEEAEDELESDIIPNAITPNGDGLNDRLIFPQLINSSNYPDNELLVFNRWGDEVYLARPYNNDWEGSDNFGKKLVDGTYYYILRLDIAEGVIIRGGVTVIR